MREDRIPFSHILPVIDLALLVALVFVPITMTTLRLYQSSKGAELIHVHSDLFEGVLQRSQIIPWSIRAATVPKARLIKEINLPGTIFEVLLSLPISWPAMWHPAALLKETWEALVWPFFCLPFWWLVGCGLDGLIGRERLHWSLLLIGTLFAGTSLALFLYFGISAAEQGNTRWLMHGLIGWTIAFAVLPLAWMIQSIRERATARL